MDDWIWLIGVLAGLYSTLQPWGYSFGFKLSPCKYVQAEQFTIGATCILIAYRARFFCLCDCRGCWGMQYSTGNKSQILPLLRWLSHPPALCRQLVQSRLFTEANRVIQSRGVWCRELDGGMQRACLDSRGRCNVWLQLSYKYAAISTDAWHRTTTKKKKRLKKCSHQVAKWGPCCRPNAATMHSPNALCLLISFSLALLLVQCCQFFILFPHEGKKTRKKIKEGINYLYCVLYR